MVKYTSDVDAMGTLRIIIDAIRTCGIAKRLDFIKRVLLEMFGQVMETPQK
jgi:GDP-D-mannose dehydratase